MTHPDTCQKCGRPFKALIPDVGIQFECATIIYGDGYVAEALPCYMHQGDQLAERVKLIEIERDELKVKASFDELALQKMEERVKRLEEVADIMATAYEEILFDNHDARILENYRKVRSEKGHS